MARSAEICKLALEGLDLRSQYVVLRSTDPADGGQHFGAYLLILAQQVEQRHRVKGHCARRMCLRRILLGRCGLCGRSSHGKGDCSSSRESRVAEILRRYYLKDSTNSHSNTPKHIPF